jgi:peptide/nickel transport system substrate-binding protein
MNKVKRILALPLVFIMAASIAACSRTASGSTTSGAPSSSGASKSSSAPSAAAAPKKDTLEIQVDSDSGSLSPATVSGGLYAGLTCLYESLWEVDEKGNVIYLLAESVEEKSPTQWIVHLRHDVKFTNGNPLTADDVIFSIEYFKSLGVNAVRVQSLDVPNCKAIDDYTVDLRMTSYYVMNWSACSMLMIYDKESFNVDTLSRQPNGTGPYKLKEYVPNSYLFLDRRDDYWGAKPEIAHLNFRVVAEPSQISNALDTGSLDVATIALQDYDHVSQLAGYTINERGTGGGVQVSFNSGKKSVFNRFTDPDKSLQARQAVIAAIDPTAIINLVYYGHAEKMKCVVPNFCIDYIPEKYDNMDETYKFGFNLDRAKQLAQSSGLAGRTIILMTNGLPASVQMAEIIQGMLAEINVTVKIENYDPATAMTMVYDPEAAYDMSVSPGIAPNRRVCDLLVNGVRYSKVLSTPGAFPDNENYLKIAPLTISTVDEKERQEVTQKVLGMFMHNCLTFALCQQKTCIAMNKGLDQNSVIFAVCTGAIRWQDLKWA